MNIAMKMLNMSYVMQVGFLACGMHALRRQHIYRTKVQTEKGYPYGWGIAQRLLPPPGR